MKNSTLITRLALGAALLAAPLAVQNSLAAGSLKGSLKGPAKAHHHQDVTVTIDGKGFHPAVVNVKAGREVHLTFVSKEASCANGFTIPALKRTLNVQPGKKKEIAFTPKKGQTITFACTMNMFKGKVVAK